MGRAREMGATSVHHYENFGQVLAASGLHDQAAMIYTAALKLQPRSYDAANGLGRALEQLGRFEQALVCFQLATAIRPASASSLNNCGVVLSRLGRIDEAIDCYRQALVHNPSSAEVTNNLGEVLRKKGELREAILRCKEAIALRPDFPSAHINLANVYQDQGLLQQAVDAYRNALELNPQSTLAHTNLAGTLAEQDKPEEANENYLKAIALRTGRNDAYSNMLYMYSTFHFLSPQEEIEAARGWERALLSDGERALARSRASVRGGVFSTDPRQGRSLRVGIVSAELGRHAVAVFLQSFLDHLNHRRIHLTLFPTVMRNDVLAEHFRSQADAYVPLIEVPDSLAADRIRQEGIDVLIDTTGHTSHCHLGIFAHRAAPVQCSYIGYWSTTGLTEMDWYITDENYADECDGHFTEGLWKLPHVAHCYKGDESLPESAWAPDPDGTIWLGSFNRYNKIRNETLSLWAKVLRAIPKVKLLLEDRAEFQEETHERIRKAFQEMGIASDRIAFLPCVLNTDFPTHMRLYDRLDIALDTLPTNSGTTAFDALWMGVPLVALEGSRVSGRMAASILKALGKPEWVAQTEEEYVAIVSELVNDTEGRAKLRKSLRASMLASELCDGEGLARALEEAFEAMHDRWLASAQNPILPFSLTSPGS